MYMKQASSTETDAYVERGEVDASSSQETDEPGAGEEIPADSNAEVVAIPATVYVDVAGAVKNPGVVTMDSGSRVFQAIEAAGGELKNADTRALNLAAPVNDGDHLYIPTKAEVTSGEYPVAGNATTGNGTTAGGGAATTPGGAQADGKININTADSTALQQLNGVGPSTAQKIIDYRTANGNFSDIDALKNVSGIGEKTFEKLKDYICV
jgi:competence protein ComEA